jgi:glyoxylase-like metal-dependent hydrolase (beta-lactamase superfamily II)
MLRVEDFGPVRYFALARSYAGRVIRTSGVYFVDGLLIDTGPPNAHVEFARIIGDVDARQVVVTHHHEDHVGNAAFAANHLDRPPLAHTLTLPLVRNPKPLPLYRRVVWGSPEAFEAEALSDVLRTPQHCFQAIHTPGHAPDHVALWEPDRRWLFTGDLYLAPTMRVLRADEDVTALVASLRRLMELPDSTLFCQHAGARDGHLRHLGHKLDAILALQNRAVALREEGRTVPEIVGYLKAEQPLVKLVSGGEFSGRNLIEALLRDAGVPGDASAATDQPADAPR